MVTTTGQYRSLRFTLTTQKYHRRGVPIPLTFTIQNVGSEPVEVLGFLSPDVEVRREGQALWQLNGWQKSHRVISAGDGYFGWFPGVKTTYNNPDFHIWPQVDAADKAIGPGTYTLEASLPVFQYNGESISEEDRENAPRSLPIEITVL